MLDQNNAAQSNTQVLVVISAYNEARSIARVVQSVQKQGFTTLVVNDGSRDNTADLARQAGAMVVSHPCNMGVTATLQTGYAFALQNGFDIVVQLDGDGQHESADIPNVLTPILEGRADMVIGSRFCSGAGQYDMPALRRFGRNVFRFWLKKSGLTINDPTSGFKTLNEKTMKLYLTDRFPDDYPDANILLLANRNGLRLMEAPVRMYPNSEGKSIHNGWFKPIQYSLSMTLSLCMIELRYRLEQRKNKAEQRNAL